MKTLIIIPTYCEEQNINNVLSNIFAANLNCDVLVVDDGSTDGTPELVTQFIQRKKNDNLKSSQNIYLISNSQNRGLGVAYATGFSWANARDYDFIAEMDADGSHTIEDLINMLSKFESFDFVVGSRYIHGGKAINWSLRRRILSVVANFYARKVLRLNINDLTSGFCVWRAQVIKQIAGDLTANGFFFQIELKKKAIDAGFSCKEVAITFLNRKLGSSKMNFKIIIEGMIGIWRL